MERTGLVAGIRCHYTGLEYGKAVRNISHPLADWQVNPKCLQKSAKHRTITRSLHRCQAERKMLPVAARGALPIERFDCEHRP